jgi:hypothetical protein
MEFDGTEDVMNIYQFRLASGGPMSDENAVIDILAILEVLYTIIVNSISLVQLFRDIRVFNVTQDVLLGLHDWPTMTAGTATGDPTPPGCAAVVNFSTIVPKVTLRKYFGVFTEADVDASGYLSTTLVADIADMGLYLLGPIGALSGTWAYGFISPKILGWVSPNGSSNNNIPGYQRRRKQGRGT